MKNVVSVWSADFKPAQREVETTLSCIARGHARHQPMLLEDRKSSYASEKDIRNNQLQRSTSSQAQALKPSTSINPSSEPPSPDYGDRPRLYSVPSQTSLSLATPNYNLSSARSPSPNDLAAMHAPAGPRADYFTRDRLSSTSSLASIAAAKKKPPPPPPTKRKNSAQGLWVTALYEFAGQGQGDLVFREGDRIKVIKKTESTDDWWEGELKGVQGSFPANYCQAA